VATGKGLRYGAGGIGKHEFRVREAYVADRLIPLIRAKAVGAAKLDLVLRGVALLPEHAGKHVPGTVLSRFSYEYLHDLARAADTFGAFASHAETPPEIVAAKRNWVREQLQRLETLDLVRRDLRPGRRPSLIVLRDDGSGEPFDDPDGSEGNSYVRILGTLIAHGQLAGWGGPQLSAYLAAMTAERYTDAARGIPRQLPGTGIWFRQLDWFADPANRYGPPARVRMQFSVATLERGMVLLEEEGLLKRERTTTDPFLHRRLSGPRVVYTNRFYSFDGSEEMIDEDDLIAALEGSDDEP
jgi:hypothetical protein